MNEALFVKTGPPRALDMFEAEAEGLKEIAATGTIRVPEVYDVGTRDGEAFIALERIGFERSTAEIEHRLGEQLAALHAVTKKQYGWHRDNTIGPTPQHNPWSDDWVVFFREHRLVFQLRLARQNGYAGELQDLGERLAGGFGTLFDGYVPDASLLHGDLWGGNWGAANGEPVIFDPAVYYGDRESDIAMTMLFGGFGRAFYEAYQANAPMGDGHELRLELYKLYHLLNHLNLFGAGYLDQALGIMRRLCREIR